jgi:archaellum component FlaC
MILIRKHLSSLEKYKTEYSELKKEYREVAERYSQVGEKILKKEVEVEEEIAQHKALLEEVFGRSQEDFNALMKTRIGDQIIIEGRNTSDDGQSKDDLDKRRRHGRDENKHQ